MEFQREINEALRALTLRQGRYRVSRRYYDGEHELRYASDEFLREYGDLFRRFTDNLCPKPVDALKSRLILDGVQRRGQDGAAVASLFDTLVQSIGAESCLERIRASQDLEDDDWFKLQQLLGVPQHELMALFGPGRTPSRT